MWKPAEVAALDLSEIRAEYWDDETPARRILRENAGEEFALEMYCAGRWLGEALAGRGVTQDGAVALAAAAGDIAASLYREGHSEPWVAAAIVLEARSEWEWLVDRSRVRQRLEATSLNSHGETDPIWTAIGRVLATHAGR